MRCQKASYSNTFHSGQGIVQIINILCNKNSGPGDTQASFTFEILNISMLKDIKSLVAMLLFAGPGDGWSIHCRWTEI